MPHPEVDLRKVDLAAKSGFRPFRIGNRRQSGRS